MTTFLENWAVAMLLVSTLSASLFPVLYLFVPWYETRLGRRLMLQATAFALALLSTVFVFFKRDLSYEFYLWLNTTVFTLLAIASSALTYKLVKWNFWKPLRRKENKDAHYERTGEYPDNYDRDKASEDVKRDL